MAVLVVPPDDEVAPLEELEEEDDDDDDVPPSGLPPELEDEQPSATMNANAISAWRCMNGG